MDYTKGQLVWWVDEKGEDHPAIITRVLKTEKGETLIQNTCSLTVFCDGHEKHVDASLGTDAGNWHLTEIVTEDEPEKTTDDEIDKVE